MATMQDWVAACVAVIRESLQLGKAEAVRESFKVPGTPADYVEALRVLVSGESWEEIAPFFVSDHDGSHLDAELASRCEQGLIDEGYGAVLRALKTLGLESDWSGFCDAIKARLAIGQTLEAGELDGCLGSMWYLDSLGLEQARATLSSVATSGTLVDQLQQAAARNDYRAMAYSLVTTLIHHPSGQIPTPQGQTQQGTATYTELLANGGAARHVRTQLVQLIQQFGLLRQILDVLGQAPPSSLIDEIVATLAGQENALELFTPGVLYVHRHYLSQALDAKTHRELIVKSCRHGGLMKYLTDLKFDVRAAPTYLDVVKANAGHGRQAFIKSVVADLQALASEQWEKELGKESSSVMELSISIQAETPMELRENLTTPLLARVKEVTDGELEPNSNDNQFSDLVSTLEASAKKTLLRDVRDYILAQGENDDIELALSLYGPALLTSGVLREKADDIVRLLARSVIDRSSVKEILALTEVLRDGSLLLKAAAESRTALDRKLKEAIADDDIDEETRAALTTLREVSGAAS